MTISTAPMANGASVLAPSTLAAMVNKKMNVPISSTAYLRPAAGGPTPAAARGTSGGGADFGIKVINANVGPQPGPVLTATAQPPSPPAAHSTYPPAATPHPRQAGEERRCLEQDDRRGRN